MEKKSVRRIWNWHFHIVCLTHISKSTNSTELSRCLVGWLVGWLTANCEWVSEPRHSMLICRFWVTLWRFFCLHIVSPATGGWNGMDWLGKDRNTRDCVRFVVITQKLYTLSSLVSNRLLLWGYNYVTFKRSQTVLRYRFLLHFLIYKIIGSKVTSFPLRLSRIVFQEENPHDSIEGIGA